MKTIRIAWRLVFFIGYTALIVAEVLVRYKVFRQGVPALMRVRRRWCRNLLPGAGIRLSVEGTPPQGACIIVGNHRAHLDPLLLLRDVDGYPVAKAEIEGMPLIGLGGRLAGMLFVQRDDPGSRVGTIRAIVKVLQAGFPVIIFPEGDTSDFDGTKPFKRAVFEIAARYQIPVVPVAILFEDAADCWVTQEHYLKHAARRFSRPRIHMGVRYGPMLRGTDAQALLEDARAWINVCLGENPMYRGQS